MADNKISPQGYDYPDTDKIYHPFYEDEETTIDVDNLPIASKTRAGIVKIGDGVDVSADGTISVSGGGGTATTPVVSATASVSNTVGIPTVTVTKTGTTEAPNFDFAFTNLKGAKGDTGETGATGPQGETGATGATGATGPEGPQGPQGEKGETGAAGKDGVSPIVVSTGNTGSGEIAGTITGSDAVITVYNGQKGETGETGPAGETGATGATGPEGPQGEAGKDGVSPTVTSTGSTESGAIAGTITGSDGTTINVYNGAKGADGTSAGDAYVLPTASATTLGGIKIGSNLSISEDGTLSTDTQAVDTSNLVSNVSMTNENGVYALSQTKGDATTEIGNIEVPSTDNLLAEVTDTVVSNDTAGYDFHTLKETENNGTQNEVGKAYIAQKQITGITASGNQLNIATVDQSGNEATQSVEVDASGTAGTSFEATNATNYSTMTFYKNPDNNKEFFVTNDNQSGLQFGPLMDIDAAYDSSTHKITLYAAAGAMHTSGDGVDTGYYETKTTKELDLSDLANETSSQFSTSELANFGIPDSTDTGFQLGRLYFTTNNENGTVFSAFKPNSQTDEYPKESIATVFAYTTTDGTHYLAVGTAKKTSADAVPTGNIYNIPIVKNATTTKAGLVKPDGTTITISDGVISAATQTPAIATTSAVGTVKPDGSTITIADDGTISAAQSDNGVVSVAGANSAISNANATRYDLSVDASTVSGLVQGPVVADNQITRVSYADAKLTFSTVNQSSTTGTTEIDLSGLSSLPKVNYERYTVKTGLTESNVTAPKAVEMAITTTQVGGPVVAVYPIDVSWGGYIAQGASATFYPTDFSRLALGIVDGSVHISVVNTKYGTGELIPDGDRELQVTLLIVYLTSAS